MQMRTLALTLALWICSTSGAVDIAQLRATALDGARPMAERLNAALQFEQERRRSFSGQYRPGLSIEPLDVEAVIESGLRAGANEADQASTMERIANDEWVRTFGSVSESTRSHVRALVPTSSEKVQDALLYSAKHFNLGGEDTERIFQLAAQRVWNPHYHPEANWFGGGNTDRGAGNGLRHFLANADMARLQRFFRESAEAPSRLAGLEKTLHVSWGNVMGLERLQAMFSGLVEGYHAHPDHQLAILKTMEKVRSHFNSPVGTYGHAGPSVEALIGGVVSQIVLNPLAPVEQREMVRDSYVLRSSGELSGMLAQLPLDDFGYGYVAALFQRIDHETAANYLATLFSEERVKEFRTLARLVRDADVLHQLEGIGEDVPYFHNGYYWAEKLSKVIGSYLDAVLVSKEFSLAAQDRRDAWTFVHALALLNARRDISLSKLATTVRMYPYLMDARPEEIRRFPSRTRSSVFPPGSWIPVSCGDRVRELKSAVAAWLPFGPR